MEGAGRPADRVIRRLAALALLPAAALAAGPGGAAASGPVRPATSASAGASHDLHLSHTRLFVDGATVTARIRLFEDDLARALGLPAGSAPPGDAQVVAYVQRTVTVRADGTVLGAPAFGGSGREVDAQGQPVRWVVVTWRAARPIGTLALRHALLFETFADQQNIVIAARGSGETRRTLSFQAGDAGEQVVRF